MPRCPHGYTSVMDPASVAEILRRDDDFAPTNSLTAVQPLRPATLRRLALGGFSLPAVLGSQTGPAHAVVREAVAEFFTASAVQGLREPLREWTRERCDLFERDHRLDQPIDLCTALLRHIPPRAFTALTGIEMPDAASLQRWGRDSLALFWGWSDPERELELAQSAVELHQWLRANALPAPQGSLLWRVGQAAEQAGIALTQEQVLSLGFFAVIAGQETTTLLINTVLTRALHGGDDTPPWADHCSRRVVARTCRDVLARQSSVPAWRRRALHDTQVGDTVIAAGEDLHLHLSGHGGPSSLAFGGGAHRCLGALLAPVEVESILAELATRWPRMRLVGEPERVELSSFSAPAAVTVIPDPRQPA